MDLAAVGGRAKGRVDEGIGLGRIWLRYEIRRGMARGVARLVAMASRRIRREVMTKVREVRGVRGR